MEQKRNHIIDLVKEHEKYRVNSCINLGSHENCTSEQLRSVLGSDLCHRNMSPDPIFFERGAKYMREVRDYTIAKPQSYLLHHREI